MRNLKVKKVTLVKNLKSGPKSWRKGEVLFSPFEKEIEEEIEAKADTLEIEFEINQVNEISDEEGSKKNTGLKEKSEEEISVDKKIDSKKLENSSDSDSKDPSSSSKASKTASKTKNEAERTQIKKKSKSSAKAKETSKKVVDKTKTKTIIRKQLKSKGKK